MRPLSFIAGHVIVLVTLLAATSAFAQTTQPAPSRSLIIIVPGNWGNAEFWPNVVPGEATFGSELQRAMGPGAEIYPFVWYGANKETSRETAAVSLAALIDQRASEYDRIFVVGHSNGGNIALLAAGLCHSKIEMVVCMSTPHTYLEMRGERGRLLFVPVYCTWESRQNIKAIVNIFPGGDDVPALSNEWQGIHNVAKIIDFVGLFVGLPPWMKLATDVVDQTPAGEMTHDRTVALTRSWQEHLGFPHLLDDSVLAHELPSDMPQSIVLNVANVNLKIQSFVTPGIPQHSPVHSRRMGYVIGELLRDGLTEDRVAYISSKIEARNADAGEPVPEAVERTWERANLTGEQHVGWRLNRITVNLLPRTIQIAHNLGGGLPSPLVRVLADENDGRRQLLATPTVLHTLSATWYTNFILRDGMQPSLSVLASHGILAPTELGGIRLTGSETPPPSTIIADPISGLYWSGTLDWVSVHY